MVDSNDKIRKERRKDPALPITYVNGEPVELTYSWENIPKIQLGTETGWWGDLISDEQIGSIYADTDNGPITADNGYLAQRAALGLSACDYLTKSKIASSIEADAFNPQADRVELELTVVEAENQEQEIVITIGEYVSDPYTELEPDVEEWQNGGTGDEYQNSGSGDEIQNT
jgi:phage gp46-like protein